MYLKDRCLGRLRRLSIAEKWQVERKGVENNV